MSQHRGRRLAVLAAGAGLLLASCTSDASPPASEGGRARLERRNREYLVGIGWRQEQAACVSRHETQDLAVLLDGAHDDDPTTKAGYLAFAKVAQACIRAHDVLTTTTTGPSATTD
ncbi:MAG: hypothetical protein JWM89_3518 [Acidimicrobiales bacterium]|nr:hypothetical protein [Acidimicrobiales bacterium]